jgi:hypothetical protein
MSRTGLISGKPRVSRLVARGDRHDRARSIRFALGGIVATTVLLVTLCVDPAASQDPSRVVHGSPVVPHLDGSLATRDPARIESWKQRWQQNIVNEARARYCDTQMGEEIGWLISPLLNGFYYGYLATQDPQWVDRLIDCTDSWIKRGVIEPDGFVGWPKVGAAGTDVDDLNSYFADSLLGEAMALRPVVLMAAAIHQDPALKARYGGKADSYIKLARSMFEKWDRRGAWRPTDGGTITVVLPFGINPKTGTWTDGFGERGALDRDFSHPDNKANMVASWLLAMFDATGDSAYRDRAEKWFRIMKSRMIVGSSGAYRIWNYWEPAGEWDYRRNGAPKHWVGGHTNVGYYAIDVDAIVEAYQHGVVFTRDDIRRLIMTALAESRLWPALAPYDTTIQRQVEGSMNPDEWAGLVLVPWYLSLTARKAD